ncbi:MAG: hypothetical protein K5656_11085 [Lachnospiraceae bacterium]|nr:hypothetical protein [Lachnospiraceae bacterium]
MKRFKRIVALALAFSLALSLVFNSTYMTNAAKLSKKKITVTVGSKAKIKLKNNKKKVKWKLSNSKAKILKKNKKRCTIKALKAGSVKLTAKVGKKKYICKIKIVKKTLDNNSSEAKTDDSSNNSTSNSPSSEIESTTAAYATTDDFITTEPYGSTTTADKTSTDTGLTTEANKTTEANATTTESNATTTEANATTTAANATTEANATTTAATTTTEAKSSGTTENAGEYSLSSKHTGDGTFYDRESTGACNLDDYESVYYTVAMNDTDFKMNGSDYSQTLAGAYIEITDKDGDVVKAMVTDRLPEGKKGDVDMTRKTFKTIEPEVTGRMNITWKIIALPTDEPISYLFKPTSSQWWAEIQVRNHRYPIKSLEYLDKTTNKYVALEKQEYNYFTAPNGMGEGPYTFRVTDIYGRQLIDKNIAINQTSTPVTGKANFSVIN